MTDNITPLAVPNDNTGDDLPTSWSESARSTYLQIEEENPNLDTVALAGLYEACNLLAAADAMQVVVDREGLMSTGAAGQPVSHPLISEIRMHRAEATKALRSLGLLLGQTATSKAAAAMAMKRHHGVRAASPRIGR